MKKWLAMVLLAVLALSCASAELTEIELTDERLSDEVLLTYYDGSLFVGDSLPRMLRNYIVAIRDKNPAFFRDVKFYTAYSYQMITASLERPSATRVNLTFRGSDATMCEIAGALQPPKLFFLAGLNDVIGEHIDRGMDYVDKIMALMEKYAPNTQVYFFSLTPVTAKVEAKRHIQAKWDAYNEALEAKCEEVGATYIDIATNLKGEDGVMRKGISHDGEYHLNDKGNAIWVQTLLDFAQAEYEAGRWLPDLTAAD